MQNKIKVLHIAPYIILFIASMFFFATHSMTSGDDSYFATALDNTSLLDWLILRYFTWTSRIIIELPLVLVAGSALAKPIYMLINSSCLVIIAYIFASMSQIKSNAKIVVNVFICCIMYFFWATLGYDSGSITMSAVYLWPLAACCISVYPLILYLVKKENVNKIYMIIGALSAPFGVNFEQYCVVMFLLFSYFVIAAFKQNNKNKAILIYSALILFICLAMLIIQLTCPGNTARSEQSYIYFYDFDMMSFLEKIEMGASATADGLFFTPNFVWGVFYIVIAFAGILFGGNFLQKFITVVPMMAYLIFGVLPTYLPQEISQKLILSQYITQYGTIYLQNHNDLKAYLPFVIMMSLILFLIISVYIVFGNTKVSITAVFILLCGLAARMSTIVSANIWASGARTNIVMYFCFFAVIVFMLSKIITFIDKEKINTLRKITPKNNNG